MFQVQGRLRYFWMTGLVLVTLGATEGFSQDNKTAGPPAKSGDKLPASSPLTQLLAANNPAKLTPAQREAIKTLLVGSPLTAGQRDLLHTLQKSKRPGLTSAMRRAIAEGLTNGTVMGPLAQMLAPKDPCKLSAAERKAVQTLVAGAPVTAMQRDLLNALRLSSRPGLTAAMRHAIADELGGNQHKNGKTPDSTKGKNGKATSANTDHALDKMIHGDNPLPISAAQREAVQALLSGRPLTQAQRNLLTTLRTSGMTGVAPEMRLALAKGLTEDLERRRAAARIPVPGTDAALLRKILDPTNPYQLPPLERSILQRLLTGNALTSTQRDSLIGMRDDSKLALPSEMRLALTDALRRDLERPVKARETIQTSMDSLPVGSKPGFGKTMLPEIGRSLTSAQQASLLRMVDTENTLKLTAAERGAVKALVAADSLTQAQRDLAYHLLGRNDPPLSPALRLALANGLRDDLARKVKKPALAQTDSLASLLEPGNASKLTALERTSIQRLLAGSLLHELQRNALFGMLRKQPSFLSTAQRLAITQGLKDDQQRELGQAGQASGGGPLGNSAREFWAVIRKVDGNKITVTRADRFIKGKFTKGKSKGEGKDAVTKADPLTKGKIGKGDDVILTVADNVKVLQGKRNKGTKKFEVGDPIENGLQNELFSSGKTRARITTDDKGAVTQIVSMSPGDVAAGDPTASSGGDPSSGTGTAGDTTTSGGKGACHGDDGADKAGSAGASADPKETATDTSPKETSGPTETGKETGQRQFQRYLLITNSTQEKLTIHVQYFTQKNSEEWSWVPGNPEQNSTQAVKMEIDPQGTVNVRDGDTSIKASRVRIWAAAAGGTEWNEYKTQDLLLVPEEDDQGQRWYAGAAMDTFTFTFSRDMGGVPVDPPTKGDKAIESTKGSGAPDDLGRLAQLLKDKGAHEGDVQISLFWSNKNDLDLHVVAPSGQRIFYGKRKSKCNGELDVDMNVDYDKASSEAVENVFWPKGQAPSGRYKVLVVHFRNHNQADTEDPTAFRVRVVAGGNTRWFDGAVVHDDPTRREVLVHEFEVK